LTLYLRSMGLADHDATPRPVRAALGSVTKRPQHVGTRPAWPGSTAFHHQRPSVTTRLRPPTWGLEPEEGFEPSTFRLPDECSASIWKALGGSCLLTLGAPSVQTAPDGSRGIVWMIIGMIKRIRRRIGWQGEQPAATEDPERMYRGFDCSARSPRGSPAGPHPGWAGPHPGWAGRVALPGAIPAARPVG
jgi:hypothetical protein